MCTVWANNSSSSGRCKRRRITPRGYPDSLTRRLWITFPLLCSAWARLGCTSRVLDLDMRGGGGGRADDVACIAGRHPAPEHIFKCVAPSNRTARGAARREKTKPVQLASLALSTRDKLKASDRSTLERDVKSRLATPREISAKTARGRFHSHLRAHLRRDALAPVVFNLRHERVGGEQPVLGS